MNVRNNTKKSTPFCKVCMDAGKGPEIYNSHYVKGDAGKVTCPTLLALECRFCFKSGHTVKYCAALEKKKQNDAKQQSQVAKSSRKPSIVTPQLISLNQFDCLFCEEDEEREVTISEQSPPIRRMLTPHTPPSSPPQKTWASVASQVAPVIVAKEEPSIASNLVSVKEILSEKSSNTDENKTTHFTFGKYKMRNWADWSDSDEE
jgi:hypothetical protein